MKIIADGIEFEVRCGYCNSDKIEKHKDKCHFYCVDCGKVFKKNPIIKRGIRYKGKDYEYVGIEEIPKDEVDLDETKNR